MKFKDKDGNTFEDIQQARRAFCFGLRMAEPDAMPCCECPVATANNGEFVCCTTFVIRNPAEADRLMGYEVEDELYSSVGTCGICEKFVPMGYSGFGRCAITDEKRRSEDKCNQKEANMDKQKLRKCDRCGEEYVVAYPHKLFPERKETLENKCGSHETCTDVTRRAKPRVKPLKDWTLGEVKEYCRRDGNGCFGCPFLSAAIGCISNRTPCSWDLTEKPRFTAKEVEAAKWLQRLFPNSWDEIKCEEDGTVYLRDADGWEAATEITVFPSIQPGQTVKLSEIVGGENDKAIEKPPQQGAAGRRYNSL